MYITILIKNIVSNLKFVKNILVKFIMAFNTNKSIKKTSRRKSFLFFMNVIYFSKVIGLSFLLKERGCLSSFSFLIITSETLWYCSSVIFSG